MIDWGHAADAACSYTDYRVLGLARDRSGREIVRLSDDHGRIMRWDPRTVRPSLVSVFQQEERDLAKGDRIQWRLVNKPLELKNADRGTIETLDGTMATIRWDRDGMVKMIDLGKHRTWDHGYAETVYSAQSKTYDRAYVLAPVGSGLVNGQNYYTAITRARFGVKLWTENKDTLASILNVRSGEKTSALESLQRLNRDRHHSFERHDNAVEVPRPMQAFFWLGRRDIMLLRVAEQRDIIPHGPHHRYADSAREVAGFMDRILRALMKSPSSKRHSNDK